MPDWDAIRAQRQQQPGVAGVDWDAIRRQRQGAPSSIGEALPEEEFDTTEPPPREGFRTSFYEPPDEEGLSAGQQFGVGGALAGAGLLAAGLARKSPHMTVDALRKLGRAVNTARYTSMLSGLAPIKSALGNLGAPWIESALRGTLKPARAFGSTNTIKDWWAAFKDPALAAKMQGLPPDGMSKFNIPGRVMSAGDYATQRALTRGGLTTEEAQRATLMSPLRGTKPTGGVLDELGKALESPAAETLIPFRRIPFNQFNEGLRALPGGETWKQGSRAQAVTLASMAAGSAAGAATANQDYPVFPAVVAATAGRFGVPAALAAALTRLQMGKSGGGIAGSVLPVSEYGFEETLKNPLRPLDPNYWGIRRAYRRLVEGR